MKIAETGCEYQKRLAALVLLTVTTLVSSCSPVARSIQGHNPPANAIWLDTLDLEQAVQDFDSTSAQSPVDSRPLILHGVTYLHGFRTHGASSFSVDLKGAATRFISMVGVEDGQAGSGAVVFQIILDGKKAADTGSLRRGQEPKLLSVDLTGAKRMLLKVIPADKGSVSSEADWAGAAIVLAAGSVAKPTATVASSEPPPPIIFPTPDRPAIHGPRIVGSAPHHPFLFLIPATGKPPLTYHAIHLPPGLVLDSRSGIITGSLQGPGTYNVTLTVRGPAGVARRMLTIVGGPHQLALTPPMGWNSWNIWADAVNDQKIRAAADWLVKSGLAAHGFEYVNIDDTWEGKRLANGQITSNRKFPDMKALSDYVHRKGLKLGIYSSPGPTTCAGFPGSYGHESQDARTYASWGVDYLKYDWCSYGSMAHGNSLEELQKPYRVMETALDTTNRDILYSLCQYGMGDVWTWGAAVGGNSWRTTRDITDNWKSLQHIGFSQNGLGKWAGPGHWNDPDMLVVGSVGWGKPHLNRLTPNEQLLHISLWCLLSAPLLTGCDPSNLDTFTLALLSNDEVLDIDQDSLGKPAARIGPAGDAEVWARALWDGTMAVGLFNRGIDTATITIRWQDLKLKGPQPVRNLWLHRDLGSFQDSFATPVPAHGAVLVKVGRPLNVD